jgi:hypothetical protein
MTMPKPTITIDDVRQLRDWMTDTADLANPGDRQARLTLDALLVDLAELSINVEEWNEAGFIVLDDDPFDPDDSFDQARAAAKAVCEAIGWKADVPEAKAG